MFIPLNSLNKKRFDLLVYNYQDQIKVLSSDACDWFSCLIPSCGFTFIVDANTYVRTLYITVMMTYPV